MDPEARSAPHRGNPSGDEPGAGNPSAGNPSRHTVVRRTGWLLSLLVASLFGAGYAIYWLIRSARL